MTRVSRRAWLLGSAALLASPVVRADAQGRHGLAIPPVASPVPVDDADVIALTRALARIPSFTTEEQQAAAFLHDLFQREGLESQVMEVDPGRVQVVARLRGSGGGRTLMVSAPMRPWSASRTAPATCSPNMPA